MVRFIALYLPQFHPTPENDRWWGKGFTEWRCVAPAKKLFPGHYQPHIPADLGFYDLRIPEVRESQAQMAKAAGVEGFCYWHYWFGNGHRLLEHPFQEVVRTKKPDFPFCLAWANHDWEKKMWDKNGSTELLMKQTYPGYSDYTEHFQSLLTAFQDKRYIKVDGKILFIIYHITADNRLHIKEFISTWRKLSAENGLNGFYFVARDADCRQKDNLLQLGFDAVYDDNTLNIHHHLNVVSKVWLHVCRNWLNFPTVLEYKKAINYMLTKNSNQENVIPVIAPNWDHSPRSGGRAIILNNSKPKYWKILVIRAIECVQHKPKQHQLVIIKSWNEWGEGNHLEPDLKYGNQYLNILKDCIDKNESK